MEGVVQEKILAGRYRLVRPLREGMHVSLWLALDLDLDATKVVVETLPPVSAIGLRDFRRIKEATIKALKLLHSNIASIRSLQENDGEPFLVIDFFEGQGLDACLDSWGTLSETEVKTLLTPVASAIDYAHDKEVVHRDLRPSNIVVGAADGVPYVLGFCTSCEIRESLARVYGGNAAGPVSYMSPEQLSGAAPTPAQDVYSFAAIAYECLAGHPPFHRGQVEYQIVNEDPEPLPGDTPLTRAVMRALSKDPAERPASCAEILEGDRPKIDMPEVVAAKTPKSVLARIAKMPSSRHSAASTGASGGASASGKPAASASGSATSSASARTGRHHGHHHGHHSHRDAPERKVVTPEEEQAQREQKRQLAEKIKAHSTRQAVVMLLILAVVVGAALAISSCRSDATRQKEAPVASNAAAASSLKYPSFAGISFGQSLAKMPEPGEDLGFGVVAGVGVSGNAFDVDLAKPLYKVFPRVRIGMVGIDEHGGGKIASLTFTKEGEGVGAARAEKVVAKIASLIGAEYGIDMGEPQNGIGNSYFSQKFKDDGVDIRISCAVSQDSTSIFVSVENVQVKALWQLAPVAK